MVATLRARLTVIFSSRREVLFMRRLSSQQIVDIALKEARRAFPAWQLEFLEW
jgi:uncharacterized protein YjiS (DUF1127 family)